MADFEAARADFVPLSLRDIKLEKSDVSWVDIGGKSTICEGSSGSVIDRFT